LNGGTLGGTPAQLAAVTECSRSSDPLVRISFGPYHGSAAIATRTPQKVLDHQAINLRLHQEFAMLGIEFAYPTQKVFVVSIPAQEAA
jgi:hypothetical protein